MSSPQYLQLRPHDQHTNSKTTTAIATLIGDVVLAAICGVKFSATVIGLAVATPLLVVLSPLIVPAVVAIFLIVSGLVVSGVWAVAAAFVFYWVYCYGGGKRQIEYAKDKLANVAREMKERIAAARLGSPVTAGRENNLHIDITVD